MFLGRQQVAEVSPDRGPRNSRDVVAGHNRFVFEAVRAADRHLGREPSDGAGNRGDRDRVEVWANVFAGEDEDWTGLVKRSKVYRPHQSMSMGRLAAHVASSSRSPGWAIAA